MRLWFCLYLLGPILVGVLLNEYKNDIFKLIRTVTIFGNYRNQCLIFTWHVALLSRYRHAAICSSV